MKRKVKYYNLPKRILILCEGESERIYLSGLKKKVLFRPASNSIEIEVYQPKNFTPLGLVNEAKKRIGEAKRDKYPFDKVWVVFDRDSHPKIPDAFEIARCSNPKINVVFSNICFEIWVLMHYTKTQRSFANSDEVIKYLEDNFKLNYTKTMNIYDKLKDRVMNAIENCAWLLKQNSNDLNNGKKPYELDVYTDFDQIYNYLDNL